MSQTKWSIIGTFFEHLKFCYLILGMTTFCPYNCLNPPWHTFYEVLTCFWWDFIPLLAHPVPQFMHSLRWSLLSCWWLVRTGLLRLNPDMRLRLQLMCCAHLQCKVPQFQDPWVKPRMWVGNIERQNSGEKLVDIQTVENIQDDYN